MTVVGQEADDHAGHGATSRRPGISDVLRGYQLLLGRELENVAVAGAHIAKAQDIWGLVEGILHSPEARHRRMALALGEARAMHEAGATSPQHVAVELDRMLRSTCDRWRRDGLGEHHKRLTRSEPRFSERSVGSNLAQALERGKAEWSDLHRQLDRLGWQGEGDPAVTALGVEAYRLLGAGRETGLRLVAIELLEADVGKGRRAEQMVQMSAARLLHLAEGLADLQTADIFYSVAALQYVPPPVIVAVLRQCVRAVREGGCAVVQVPAGLHGYTFDGAVYLDAENAGAAQDFHCVSQAEILDLLADEGFRILEVVPDERASVFGLSYTYFARKAAAAMPPGWCAGNVVHAGGRPPARSIAASGHREEDAFAGAEWIVQRLYRSVLGRDADVLGLAHYTDMIWDGAHVERTLTATLMGSPEYRERTDPLDATGTEMTVEGCRFLLPADQASRAPCDLWALPYLLGNCAPGSTVLDLAAGIGVFAIAAARCVQTAGRVYAVMPSPADCATLVRNVALNRLENVELLPIAAHSAPSGEGGGVPVDRLRPFLRKIDIVRLDAAGVADRSLYGAIEIIRADRPTIFLEYAHDRQEPRSALEANRLVWLLAGLGYRFEILHREQPRQIVDPSDAVATIEAAWKARPRSGAAHLDLCLRPARPRF